MGYTYSRRKHGRKFLSKSKKRIFTTIISYVNINELNNFNILNSDNIIGTSKFPHGNVQNGSSFNTLVTLHKLIVAYSIVIINGERTDQNHMSEEISCRQNSAEILDHTCDDNGINLVNKK